MTDFSKGFESEYWGLALKRAERISEKFGRCESPIEVAFATAICLLVESLDQTYEILAPGDEILGRFAIILPQFPIEPYRVDFVVVLDGFERRAVVECDGRDFHHSTREQIERDRERDRKLEGRGPTKVFRFPGTQIHNEPFSCAEQVLLWLMDGPRRTK